MQKIRSLRPLVLAALALSFIACQPSPPPSEETKIDKPTHTQESLIMYSGRSQVLIEPLLKAFTEQTGIAVDVRYDKSTQNLATRLLTEGEKTQADIFFAQDSGYLGALGQKNLLAKLPQDVLDQVATDYRDAQGQWVATSGRARVLVYDASTVKPETLPKSLKDLANPQWKGKLGWAPGNASFQAHISALRHLWGEAETTQWLKDMIALEPKTYPKNSPQVKGVSNGEIQIGWVNHYYLHKLKAADPELKAANYSFTAAGDAGNLMMLSGIAIITHSKKKSAAQKLINFLLSEKSQAHFTTKIYEYPTRTGINANEALPAITSLMSKVPQEHLADVGGTLKMLRELKLQ